MDWSNEPYVRVYTRETDDDLALSWEAMALWNQLMKRFDRSGYIETRRGARGLAAITRIPLPIVTAALPELVEDGRLVEVEGGYMAPNFIAAQEAVKSDRQRQKDSRDRRRAQALDVTNRDGADTQRDAEITPSDSSVTAGHVASRAVTLCSADQASADLQTPAPARVIPLPQPVPERAARKSIGDLAWDRVNAMRAELADSNGWTDVRPLHVNDPARQELAMRLVESGADAARAVEHVLQVAFAEARAKNTVEYLGGSMFRADSWAKKLAMRVEDAKRPNRANPQSATKRGTGAIGSASPRSDFGDVSKPAKEAF